MEKPSPTNQELLDENILLKQRIQELEQLEEKRTKSEKVLIESEVRFKNMFQRHSAIMLLIDTESGNIVDANKSAVQYYGYSKSALCSMSINDINTLAPEEIRLERENALNETRNYFIFTHILANGEKRIVEVHSSPIDYNGHLLFSIIHDITERKQAEEMLRESEERYRSLLQNLEVGIVVHAPDTSVIMNNSRASELLGLSDDQMKGKEAIDPAWKFVNEENIPLSVEDYPISRVLAGKKTILNQILGIHRPGTKDIVWVMVNGFPVFDSTGNFCEIVISFMDITGLKCYEKELLERDEDLKESQRIAHVGSWHLNIATNEVTWSEELYKMYGFDPSLPPPPYNEHHKIFTPESWESLSKALSKTIETGIPYELELKTLRKDGSNGWMWVHGEWVIDENGSNVGLRGAAQDITERKHAEKAIKLNENRLKILVEILQHKSDSVNEFLDHSLNEIIKLTDSKIGYIYYYSEEKKEFTLNSWSKGVMNECTILEKQTVYELDKTGLWGEAVRQRKPIMVNDFQAENQFKKGYPTGHANLKKYLTVPVFINNKIVGVAAVANKETDYTETDILHLSLIMNSVWKVVESKSAEIALRESEEKLSTLFGSMTEMVVMHELVFNEKGEAVNYRLTDCNGARIST